jgi:hypothetical protein
VVTQPQHHSQRLGGWVWSDLAGQRNRSFVLSSAFLDKFWPVGGLMSHSQIATPNSIGLPHQIIQTYNNQPSGGWALADSAG